MGKISGGRLFEPFMGGNQNHPAATGTNQEYNDEYLGSLTQVLSSRALNEIKVGEAVFGLANANLTSWSHHWQAANGITNGGPNITFRGFRSNRNGNIPRFRNQNTYTLHDDSKVPMGTFTVLEREAGLITSMRVYIDEGPLR